MAVSLKLTEGGEQDQIDFLIEEIHLYAKKLAIEKGFTVSVNAALVYEIYYSSCRTLNYLEMDSDKIDFYKNVGHITFWICELKPVRILSGLQEEVSASKLVKFLERSVKGGSALVEAKAKVAKFIEDEESRVKKNAEFFINEHVALLFSLALISSAQKKILLDKDFENGDFEGERAKKKIFFEKQRDYLATSLRYHNYSTRVMSLLFEMTLKTSKA